MAKPGRTRRIIIAGGIAAVAGFLLYAFWPRPMLVDIGAVTRGHMMTTIDDDGKTRVRDSYIVSAPIAGRLLRVDAEPGDPVTGHETVVASLLPATPGALDVRTEEQARAAIAAADAALNVSRADVKRASAEADFARGELDRARKLQREAIVSDAALERAERAWRTALATLETAEAAVAMREADLVNARALLITPEDVEHFDGTDAPDMSRTLPLHAPVTGRILRIIQESETVVSAGAPILEVGDPAGDLEIVAELLSSDAVQVQRGDRVIIKDWGGDIDLDGVVDRVEPLAFTKFSALGVEEQRVNTVIEITTPPEARATLGHGFRVEVRIVTWENEDALMAPASAVFRSGDGWAVFAVESGRAKLTPVEAGRNNGLEVEILGGLNAGARIILYPRAQVRDGARVAQRAFDE